MEATTEIVWEEIDKLIPNPKNRNKHPKEQVERLAEIIKYQGWRHPIIVSTNSGYIVSGHGRLAAAKLLNLDKVPVHYQSFLDEKQETAFGISDNTISRWSDLDFQGINEDLLHMGPDFDVDYLGIQDFEIEPADKTTEKLCPHCGGKI